MRRRVLIGVAVAAVALAAVLVVIGRWEGSHHARQELRGMRRVLAAIGPLDNPTLSMYRVNVGFGFDCLLYKRGSNRFALEVCFDKPGRAIETLDRRGSGNPKDLEPARGSGRVDDPHRPCARRPTLEAPRRPRLLSRFRLPSPERAGELLPVVLTATIVAFTFGSSAFRPTLYLGRLFRWPLFLVLAFLALRWAAASPRVRGSRRHWPSSRVRSSSSRSSRSVGRSGPSSASAPSRSGSCS